MKRRRFISAVAAGGSSFKFWADLQQPSSEQIRQFQLDLNSAQADSDFWKTVSAQLSLSPGIVHLNSGSIGACPRIVTDALVEFTRQIENDPYRHVFGDGLNLQLERVRESAAKLLNAATDEVAITHNTTDGMNLVSRGLDLKRGDEVLTTNHEHPGGMACWQHLAKRIGLKIVYLKMPSPAAQAAGLLEQIKNAITPRTKVFSFCHIDTITGFRLPIESISRIAKNRNIFFLCDGAQGPGMLKVDVKQLGVDAYAASGHKWLLGPKSTGLLYIEKSSQSQVQSLELSNGLHVYSAASGTRDVAGILALGVALDFQSAIGSDKIEQRIRSLNQTLSDKLSRLPALTRLTPKNAVGSSGLATFAIDPKIAASFELSNRLLGKFKIHVRPTQQTMVLVPDAAAETQDYNAIRFSTHIFNSEAQLDLTANALAELLGENN